MEDLNLIQGVAVVVVPFTAQGHLNQLLHLSLLLSQRGLSVHYANSATHARQARERIQGWSSDDIANITFHDLPLPPFSAPRADHNGPNRFPSHMMPSFEASQHLQPPIAALLRSLSATSRRLVVIHEPLMSFAGRDAASLPNAEAYLFNCVPACFLLPNMHDYSHKGEEAELRKEVLDVLRPNFDGVVPDDFRGFVQRRVDRSIPAAGALINSCRPIDAEFIDLMARQPAYSGRKLYAVGPLHPVAASSSRGLQRRHECLDWLDAQPAGSVVFVSFGSTTALPDEQMKELADGLEGSGQRFIWVVRDADRGDVFAGDDDEEKNNKINKKTGWMPTAEYEKKVEERGRVIRGWAPQLGILGHASTGAFVSHCGWNSSIESLSSGVPILAWPMHSDQPRNALLVTDYLKVGLAVREWDRREETVPAAEIEEVMRRMMGSGEGEEIRKRARDLGEEIRNAASEGGSSRAELDSFVGHITR